MTNEANAIFKVIEDAGNYMAGAGPFFLTVFAALVSGYILKTVPGFPNKWIPLATLAVAVGAFVMLGNPGDAPFDMRFPVVRHAILGFGAWLLGWVLHRHVLRKWIDSKLFSSDDEPPVPPDTKGGS